VREKNTRRNLNNSGQERKRQASSHLMPCPQARHIKTNKRQARRDNMKKYRVSLEVDKEWVKNFDLTFDAVDEQDAQAQAMIEVKQNLSDYITAYADEEGDK